MTEKFSSVVFTLLIKWNISCWHVDLYGQGPLSNHYVRNVDRLRIFEMFDMVFTSTWCHHQETGFTFTVNCCAVSSITWCGRKVMRLATLCMNWQRCCLPLHMAVRLTPAVDSIQVWTCYSYYAIVESVWSEVVFVRCITKMDWQKFEQRCAIKFYVKLGESATVTYEIFF